MTTRQQFHKKVMGGGSTIWMAGAYDALSATLIDQSNFDGIFTMDACLPCGKQHPFPEVLRRCLAADRALPPAASTLPAKPGGLGTAAIPSLIPGAIERGSLQPKQRRDPHH